MGTHGNTLGADFARNLVRGTLESEAAGDTLCIDGCGNFAIWGSFNAFVVIERSFDDGETWVPALVDTAGAAVEFTAPVSLPIHEPEPGVLYRVRTTTYLSGAVEYRLSVA